MHKEQPKSWRQLQQGMRCAVKWHDGVREGTIITSAKSGAAAVVRLDNGGKLSVVWQELEWVEGEARETRFGGR